MSFPRLSIIPAGAVTDPALEGRDLQVLCLLGRHTEKNSGWCRRSQVKMAAELRCGRASVQRSLDRLVDAGWLQKKRPPWSNEVGQPSHSYMYRVILDRDDGSIIDADDEDTDSHANSASDEGGCPRVGTPPADNATVDEGAQPGGHPGAQPYVGTGAQLYVGTKNDPLERPLLERERDARARDRTTRFLANFESRWPSAAVDDRQRTAYAAAALTEAEQVAALAGIAGFLDHLTRLRRKAIPAGWRYLEEKRWTLLAEQGKASTIPAAGYPRDSVEAKAITVLHEIAGCSDGFRTIYRRDDGSISYRKEITPRLAALAQAPRHWVTLTREQAAAWEAMLRDTVTIQIRKHLREGDSAPWPWPPSIEGKIYTTGPTEALASEQELVDFSKGDAG